MGLFDTMKKMADMADKFLNDDDIDDIWSKDTVKSKYKDSVLATPPPPAIPVESESLSVRIAVNGKEYGPYEKATLLQMIENGTLTRETYVYINGMTEWKRAKDVDKVATLFGTGTPLPPIPPAPWENSQNVSSPESDSDNPFSPRLNKLITAAVADGEISDLERQVLIRTAQEEGVAMDEFVIVLEARLFEQRRRLSSQEEEKRHRTETLKAQQQVAEKAEVISPPPAPSTGKPTKCPHCGAPVKSLATACPECGHDYMDNLSEYSPSERLSMQLQKVDNEKTKSLIGGYLSLFGYDSDSPEKISKKKNIIKNFPIPSDKRNMLDLFITCATQSHSGFFDAENRNHLESAYKVKAQQILMKARIVMKDDPKLIEEIETLAKQYKIKA